MSPEQRHYVEHHGEALWERHREIDRYLFEDRADEIERMGFAVTHTAACGGHV